MQADRPRFLRWLRAAMLGFIAAAGLVAIVGSGGGGLPGWPPPCFSPDCLDLTPSVNVEPVRPVVQVGTRVSFTASAFYATAPVSYQWRRNGVAIFGATADTYTLPSANLSDDGAEFSVVVTASNGAATGSSLLRVSSGPPVRFEDTDFALADWSVTAEVEPPTGGPTHTEAQSLTGGDPGAMRTIDYQVPAGRSSIRVFHTALFATYDPAALGAPYVIDVRIDCNRLSTTTVSETYATPAFEQAGRWYAPVLISDLCAPTWFVTGGTGLLAANFRLIAGPACPAGQSCPDFSVGAAALHFGFVSGLNLPAEATAGTVSQGIDDWRVTVWRR